MFGKPVAHHQGNAFDLAHAAARVHGARLAVRDAAAAFDGDEPDAAFWATQAWLETVEAAHLATNLGIQLLGGHGFIVDHLAEKRFREARMLTMLAGARDAAELDVAAFVLDVDDPLAGRHGVIELDPRTQELLEEVRALGRTHIRPMGLEADRTATPPPVDHEFYLICTRQGGIVSRLIGDEEGPTALDWKPVRNFLVGEETAYWDRGVALSLPGPGLGGSALRTTATPEQRERFLQVFTDHSKARWGAMAMTEPSAGSDVARIQTRARKEGDEWVLTGQKMFCSNSARAEWVVVWATVDPALGRSGHRAFVVERGTPGFEILKIEHKMGSRGYETASFALDDVRVPADHLLGGEAFYESRARVQGVDGDVQHDPPDAHRPRRRDGSGRPRLRPRLRARRVPDPRPPPPAGARAAGPHPPRPARRPADVPRRGVPRQARRVERARGELRQDVLAAGRARRRRHRPRHPRRGRRAQRPHAREAVPRREDPRHRRGHPAGAAGRSSPASCSASPATTDRRRLRLRCR